jgi:capsular exopolysaccharide synthesis family protein
MELKQYLAILWHWAWLVILGVLLAGSAAYWSGKDTPYQYRTSIHLLINQAPGEGGNEYAGALFSERLAKTYTELIKKRPVMAETVSLLDLPFSPEALNGKVSVTLSGNNNIIILTVQDTDPDRAALIANTLTEVFIQQNRDFQSSRYAESIASWERALEQIGVLITSLEGQIEALSPAVSADDEARLVRLEPQLTQARGHYNQTFNQLQSLRVAQARELSNILIVEPALPPKSPLGSKLRTNVMMAAAVGGMLALGLAFLIEYLDDTIKTPEQVTIDTELAPLGVIANMKGSRPQEKLETHTMPRSPVSEAYRVVRTNLGFSAINGKLRSILVTSPFPGEGKTTTAANVAVVMAQAGKRVILVDADLRRPAQHKLFQTSNNQGLTTALLDGTTPATAHCRDTAVANLRLLSSGPLPPNPAELLNSQRMRQLLEALQNDADMVIIDSPPVLTVADATILGSQVDGTLVVVYIGRSRRDALINTVDALQKTGTQVLGVVMNRLRSHRAGYYSYYYYRYDTYEQATSRPWRAVRRLLPARLSGWLG